LRTRRRAGAIRDCRDQDVVRDLPAVRVLTGLSQATVALPLHRRTDDPPFVRCGHCEPCGTNDQCLMTPPPRVRKPAARPLSLPRRGWIAKPRVASAASAPWVKSAEMDSTL